MIIPIVSENEAVKTDNSVEEGEEILNFNDITMNGLIHAIRKDGL